MKSNIFIVVILLSIIIDNPAAFTTATREIVTRDSNGRAFVTTEYVIHNTGTSPCYTWLYFADQTPEVNRDKLIGRYWSRLIGDFRMFTLFFDNTVIGKVPAYIGAAFLKEIGAGETFKYIVPDKQDPGFWRYIYCLSAEEMRLKIGLPVNEEGLYPDEYIIIPPECIATGKQTSGIMKLKPIQ